MNFRRRALALSTASALSLFSASQITSAEPAASEKNAPNSEVRPTKEPEKKGEAQQDKAKAAAPDSKPQTPSNPHEAPHGAAPHGMAQGRPPQNRSTPDPELSNGTVVVEVVDAVGAPVKGAKVRLATLFQSIAEGNTEDVTEKQTSAEGRVEFTGLDDAIRYSYGVSVEHEGASYDAPGFRMSKVGQRVRVHTFPVTSDPKQAFVGIQGYVTVQVNDDLIRVDGVYRVINMGRSTWKPQPIFLKLPDDAQGVETKLSAGDAGFEEASGGMKMVGSFPPGQKDLPFAFHVPNTNEETRVISFSVPPHAVDMNVLTEEAPGMGLSVSPGFEPAQSRKGREDKKVLVTRRVMRPGEGQLSSIQIQLSGLPVIGPGRWIATLVALFVALLGVTATWLKRQESDEEREVQTKKARATLLDEMLLLERAHTDGAIGPRTYEQTKREILAALARLEPARLEPSPTKS